MHACASENIDTFLFFQNPINFDNPKLCDMLSKQAIHVLSNLVSMCRDNWVKKTKRIEKNLC